MLTEKQVIACVRNVEPLHSSDIYGWSFEQLEDGTIECSWDSTDVWEMFCLTKNHCDKFDGYGYVWNTVRYGVSCYFDDILREFAKNRAALQWMEPIVDYIDSVYNHPYPDWRSWGETLKAIDFMFGNDIPEELADVWADCVWKVKEDDVDRYYEVSARHLVGHVDGYWKIYFQLACGWNELYTDLATIEVCDKYSTNELCKEIARALEPFSFMRR